jgi:hypothetical protein
MASSAHGNGQGSPAAAPDEHAGRQRARPQFKGLGYDTSFEN